MTVCFIIPPHILSEIKKNGNEYQQEWAQHSLRISETIRKQRAILSIGQQSFAPQQQLATDFIKNRIIYTADHTSDLPGRKLLAEGQSGVNDPAADQAYTGTGATFDLYADVYQRNSIDDKGLDLISTVHYSEKYDNAFWDGQQMVYGDGDGELFGFFTKPIDVTGHELTHGVTQYTANLDYQDQSGALNESFSDVFGILVKQKVLNQTADASNWLIGDGILTSKVNGKALRSMKAPGTAYDDPVLGKDPQPADMAHFVDTVDDNGGVHINSGIPNHAFYLVATAIGGNAWEIAGKIWYDTLTKKLKNTANFADCANATIASAKELFGDREVQAVEKAWKTVGVI